MPVRCRALGTCVQLGENASARITAANDRQRR